MTGKYFRPAPGKVWPWLAATVAYIAAARAGIAVASLHGEISPVWPATGLAVWLVLRLGPKAGVCIVAGHFIAELWSGVPILAELSMGAGVLAEALLGAALWREVHARWSNSLREYVTPIATVAVAALPTLAAATLGTSGTLLTDVLPPGEFFRAWSTWWIGDALGAMFVLPVLVHGAELTTWLRTLSPRAAGRAGLAVSGMATVSALAFFQTDTAAMVVGILPTFLLAALALHPAATRLLGCGIASCAIFGTFNGHGPFSTGALNRDLVNLQWFLSVVAVSSHILPNFRTRRPTLPLLVLLVGWTGSGGAFYLLRQKQLRQDEADLHAIIRNATTAIDSRFAQLNLFLQNAAATLAATPDLTPGQWDRYVSSLDLTRNCPGLSSLIVVRPLAPQGVPAFNGPALLDAQPRYVVTHPAAHSAFSTIGFDLGAIEPYRTKAELAWQTRELQLAGSFPGKRDASAGSLPPLLLYPFAVADADAPAPPHAARFAAWIGGSLDFAAMLTDVLGRREGLVEFALFAPGPRDASHLIFGSGSAAEPHATFAVVRPLQLAGEPFVVAWRVGPKFKPSDNSGAVWTFLGLAFGSLLLAVFIRNLQNFRKDAEELARARTRDLEAEIARREATDRTLRQVTGFQLAILESTELAIISTDRGAVIRTFNAAAERMLGYAASDVVGHLTPAAFHEPPAGHHPEAADGAQPVAEGELANWATLCTDGKTVEREWTFLRNDGRRFPVHLTVTPMRDSAGVHIGYVGLATDISHSRAQAAALERERQLLQTLVENLPSAVFVTDAAGRYLLANPAQARSLGTAAPAEVIGRTVADFLPAGLAAATAASDREILRTGVGRYQEEEAYERGGKTGYYSVTKIPLRDSNQSISALLGIKHDITAHKVQEAALIKAQRSAEDASRAKSEFLAMMSHEIRTPMNAVIGFTELLSDTPLEDRQREYVDIIHSSGQYLITLINDILDFSKIEAGKMEIEHVRFDGPAMVQATVQTLRPGALKKGLALDFTPTAVPRVLLGDPSRFRQVLLNLLGNALKFTTHGTVTVLMTPVPASAPRALRVTVRDTGVGISREKQPLLFEKFTQADSSITREFGGSGLGLAICKRLVEMMGGKIGFNSEVGRGSTFWFEIPLAADQSAPSPAPTNLPAPAAPAQPPAVDARRRVLVADDNEVNQQLVCSFLQKLQCDVVVAPHGAEAVRLAKAEEFDLILMDHQMPVMDGCEAARAIRDWEQSTGRSVRLPIIALTANVGPRESALYRSAGMDLHLPKPLVLSALEQALAKVWGPTVKPGARPVPAVTVAPAPVANRLVDHERALDRLDGNPVLLASLAKAFAAQSHELVAGLQTARGKQDRPLLQSLAHKVKGSVGNFAADSVWEAARQLEVGARTAEWTTLTSDADHLVTLIETMREELETVTTATAGVNPS